MTTYDPHRTASSAHPDETLALTEDRSPSLGAALVGFVLSTALTSTVMVLLAQ